MKTIALSTLLALVSLSGYVAVGQTTYYARATGNWTSTSTWSTSSCSGLPASSTPGSTDNVIICAGRTVTFNASSTTTIANLTIQSTGILTFNTGRNLFLNSLVLNGTVDGNGGGDLLIGNTAGSSLSGTGIFSTSASNTQLRLVNSITIPAGTDITFDDDGRFHLNGRTVTNEGKISILDPSAIAGGGTFINNASTSHLVFSRQGNWPNATALVATATGNTVEYGAASGTRSLDNQSSYYHLIIGGGGTKRFRAANTTIRGNLTIKSGATLDTNTGTRTLSIARNWINNLGGSFNENTSLVTFNGTANNQTLNPPAGGETFYDLTINNTFSGGSVTASGNVSITSARTLTMTSGIFDMGANTLGQTGAANLTATGGDLRMGKLGTTLPEFTGTYNITGGTITFNGAGAQSIRSLNAAPANYHHIALSGAGTKTLAGNITVRGHWTNSGSTLAGNFTVNFTGSGTQTITNTSGEIYYGLTVNTTGPLVFQASTNVTVTNTLTMTSGDINLNGTTLTLGNGSGATLIRTTGTCYGGTFRRYFPVTAISSTAGSLYGLFPVGTSIYYRPVQINSTLNPTTAGYVSVFHTDATTATDVSYNDNEGVAIQRVTDMSSTVSTAALAGGLYTLSVSMSALSSAGNLTDLKMETLGVAPFGVGVTIPTTGTVSNPTVIRSGVSVANLNKTFVVGTRNRSTTPLVSTFFSRRTGNWNDATAGNATWSLTDGGPTCNCVPTTSSMVYINSGHTVSVVTTAATTDFITVRNGATLNGTANLTVNYTLTTQGTGRIAPTSGTWNITRDLIIAGTSSSTSGAALVINGDLEVDAANTLTAGNTIQAGGNLLLDGTLAIGVNTLTLSGAGASISGSAGAATITGNGAIIITSAKTILSSSNLTVQPAINLQAATTVTNLGSVTHTGNLTGANAATSVWTNGSNSVLNTTGALLATGTLDASAIPNTVNYNGSGAQVVKTPSSSYYNLILSNAGIKTTSGNFSVTSQLSILNAAILNAGTNTLNGAGSLVMSGTAEFQIGKNSAGTYPELTGSYDLTGGTITLNQSAAATGTFILRGADFYNVNLAGGGSSIYDFDVDAVINNNLTVALANTANMRNTQGPLMVTNDFTFNSTSTTASALSNDFTTGTFTLNAGSLSASAVIIEITNAGGWTRNGGTFSPAANTVVLFSGTAGQQIAGTVPTTFTRLELGNSGTGVTLNQDITISGTLTFTEGELITSSTNILTMAAGSSVATVSDDSFVNGPMDKTGNTNFTFPIGKDASYRPIGISNLSASGTFRAEYFHANPSSASFDNSIHDPSLSNVSSGEYWNLALTSGTPTARVILSWDTYSGSVSNLTDLRVARWNGSTWKDHGNGGTTGVVSPGTGTINTPAGAPLSAFGPFTLASINISNTLPVTLLDFDAKLIETEVLITWTTASEINNDYFIVEKSRDGLTFTEVASVDGAGTTKELHQYVHTDVTPYSGISYYRLRQVDYDGTTSSSKIVAVDNRGGSEIPLLSLFPNPTQGSQIYVSLKGLPGSEYVTVVLTDVSGRKIESHSELAGANGEVTSSFDTDSLTHGFYLVTVYYTTGHQNSKVIVN